MLPKAHLTSHFRMSGSRCVIIPLWLSGSWASDLYSSLVYSCYLFLISSSTVRSKPFLSFIVPIFAWKFPSASLIFLKRSLVFPILLFSAFLSLLAILWSSAFRWVYLSFSSLPLASFLFSAIYKSSLLFCISFFWGWSWSLSPVQCQNSLKFFRHSIRSNPLNLFFTSTV